MVAWAKVVIMEVMRSAKIQDLFQRYSQQGKLMDWMLGGRKREGQR